MVEDFSTVWDNLVNWLKDNSSRFGLTPDDIYDQHPLDGEALPTPYISVFALPDSEDESIPGNDTIAGVSLTVFIAGVSDLGLSQSVRNSVALANSVYKIIHKERYDVKFKNKPQAEAVRSNAAIMSFELLTICEM